MKYLKKIAAPVSIIIFSLLMIFFFRNMPQSKLWKGFTVLYVPVSTDIEIMQKVFENSGLSNCVIAMENQRIPIYASYETPEISLAMIDAKKQNESEYLNERLLYFFDKVKKVRIYYFPEEYSKNISKCIKLLKSDYGIEAGLNIKTTFPVVCPILCFLFACMLVYFSDNRILTGITLLIPVYFSMMVTFYSATAAVCIFMLAVYLALKLWNRTGAFSILLKNKHVLTLIFICSIMMFFTSLKTGLLYFIMCCSIVSVLYLYDYLSDLIEHRRYSFIPVKIRSASMIKIINNKANRCILLSSCIISTILLFSIFNLQFSLPDNSDGSSGKETKLYLPASKSRTKKLPSVNDYVSWKWSALTYPYISVNDKQLASRNEKGETISFSSFTKDEKTGFIKEIKNSITYDDAFIDESINGIDDLNYPSIESIMKKQGKNNPGYVSSESQSVSLFNIILIFLALIVPLVFYFTSKKSLKHKGDNK